jgi:hypothetical protein
MTDPVRPRPPSQACLRDIYNHHRWVASAGRFGKRLLSRVFLNCDLNGVDFSKAFIVDGGEKEGHFGG